ncbi:MAG: hypothetical protein RR296_10565 [Clostridia bacterium]
MLWPHANSRYQTAVRQLSQNELNLLLDIAGIQSEPRYVSITGADFLCFDAPELDARQLAVLSRHASAYLLCAINGGTLTPLIARVAPYLNEDLSGILKYKGKTNEAFTRLMINFALAASDFGDKFDGHLALLDPMCGRGTTLFEAINRGYDACGVDADGREVQEGWKFFRKYLEYHKLKHDIREVSLTLPGKKSARMQSVAFAPDVARFRAGDTRTLSFLTQDAQLATRALGAARFHLAVCDLPYGVQHGTGSEEPFEALLARVLPDIRRALKPGGAICLSFNTYTLPAQRVRALLDESGFTVMTGGPYENLAHWVEQAIVRDLAVARA